MKPNLFIAGFQKCGSSTLFDYLCQHDFIAGCNPKETFALTDNSYENYRFETSIHNENFDISSFWEAKTEAKYYLEGSVCNFYQKTAINYIKSIPDSKVIFIVRNPIDRLISSYYYYGGSGLFLKSNVTLEDYYNLSKHEDTGLKKEGMRFAVEHGKYLKYIEMWKEQLGEERVIIIGFKELIMFPVDTCNKIFDFLQIKRLTENEIIPKHKNKSVVSKAPTLNRFLIKYFGGYKITPNFLRKIYLKLMTKPAQKTKPNEKLLEEMNKVYRKEFEQLGHLL
jgi:hypothetical protein